LRVYDIKSGISTEDVPGHVLESDSLDASSENPWERGRLARIFLKNAGMMPRPQQKTRFPELALMRFLAWIFHNASSVHSAGGARDMGAQASRLRNVSERFFRGGLIL